MIKRKIVMGLLVLGTIGGFAMGFKSLRGGCHGERGRHHARWEDRVADVCVKAAKNAEAKEAETKSADAKPAAQEGGAR